MTGSREVEAIARGADGLKAGLKPGSVVVDCSTSDPNSTIALAAEFAPLGVDYVDAPLSRTPKEAWEGTLDTMVGASEAVFARLKPVLETWAGKVVHIGGAGDGHRMKLLNNFISLGYAALYSEALALSQKVGISPERFDSVIRGGRMDCGFYQTFMRWTLEGDRDAHKFTIANAFKDLRYLEAMADAAGAGQSDGQRGQERFRARRARRRRRAFRADAGDLCRPRQRHRGRALRGAARRRAERARPGRARGAAGPFGNFR